MRELVSSVLNRDIVSYGKKHLFDGSIETCWNSEQGTPQHVLVEFEAPVCIHEIHIQFQGGFAGKDTRLVDSTRNADICPLHPADNNRLQTFELPESERLVSRKRIKIQFASSTDFYGRIIVYALDFVGLLAEPNADPTSASSASLPAESDDAAVASDTIVII
ncbi:Nuclear receptor 2C2-associated protein [Coemansia sp. RSA 986]|nr:Nuclear receptor 2C2-associated protein [Coemansia sp. RSA 1843]KAJ2090571.1 Nuclear receptor 2C2-associated protein [Coemansia sp. RSA 986]